MTTTAQRRGDIRVSKFGARWVVEGPEGRFHARTKTEAMQLLKEADDRARGRVFYTVTWDYVGGDCGDLPWRFGTEDEAHTAGRDWVAETLADLRASGEPDLQEGDEGAPTYHVYRHEAQPDGSTHVYDEDGDLTRAIPAQ